MLNEWEGTEADVHRTADRELSACRTVCLRSASCGRPALMDVEFLAQATETERWAV